MRIVQKYGGTSLETPDRIRRAARRAAELHRQGNQVVMVVSARGNTTDRMLQEALAMNPDASPRELDAFLSAGEQMSAAQAAMAVQACGAEAVSLTGWQAGIHTDDTYGNARIQSVDPERILRELAAGKIVIAAGFQGLDANGNITTLGRGGSDTTAVALAAALNADICRIYTDVDGVYDRDPRQNPLAKRFDRIDYDRMLALARNGAQVLHDRSVELARDRGVILEVLSAFLEKPGTIVGPSERIVPNGMNTLFSRNEKL